MGKNINKREGIALLGTIILCIFIISLFFIELWLNNNVALITVAQQNDAVIYICTHILFHIHFPYGLSQDIEYSSLCYIVRPCYLSILYNQFASANLKLPIQPSPTPSLFATSSLLSVSLILFHR